MQLSRHMPKPDAETALCNLTDAVKNQNQTYPQVGECGTK